MLKTREIIKFYQYLCYYLQQYAREKAINHLKQKPHKKETDFIGKATRALIYERTAKTSPKPVSKASSNNIFKQCKDTD